LFAGPFMTGMRWAFYVSAAMCAMAALSSLLRGNRRYGRRKNEE
jgi:hypothetical protein